MQAVRFEGSLLASLSELKAIEEARVAEERLARQNAEVARLAAIEDAVRQQQAEEAARIEGARQAQLAIERAKYEAEREARLRVEAAEAAERARYEAQLQAQRQAEELAIEREKVAKQRPTWMLVVTGLAIVAAAVMVWFTVGAYRDAKAADDQRVISEKERDDAKTIAKQAKEDLAKLDTRITELDGEIVAAIKHAGAVKTKAEADEAAKHLADLRRQQAEAKKAAAKAAYEQWLRDRKGGATVDDKCKKNALC